MRRVALAAAVAALLTLPVAQAERGPASRSGPSFASTGAHPTASTPESKLWWHAGAWWASMWAEGRGFAIFRFDRGRDRWLDTGTRLDPRRETFADVVADGQRLYVASHKHGRAGPERESRLYRYRYDTGERRYLLDPGFPVEITPAAPSSLVLAKDSVGRLWATWVEDGRVYVNWTNGDDRKWQAGSPLPLAGTAVADEDVAAVVAFSQRIGLLWGNQRTGAFFFALRRDRWAPRRWGAPERLPTGTGGADNHVNVKAASDGRLYAVVKTSATSPDEALIVLLTRTRGGRWSGHLVGSASEKQTRPVVMVDEANDAVHVFTTGPAANPSPAAGTAIFRESAATADVVFPTGPGSQALYSSEAATLTDVTGAKQPITSNSGFVVLTADPRSQRYWYRSFETDALRVAAAPFPPAGDAAPRAPPPEVPDPGGLALETMAIGAAILLVVVVLAVAARRGLAGRS